MQAPSVTEYEIDEVIIFLRSKGHSNYANRVEALKQIENLGEKQYKAGIRAISEIEKTLSQRVPRDRILLEIQNIIADIKEIL